MNEARLVREVKEQTVSIHDILQRKFKSQEGRPFIDAAMTHLEDAVKQLEALEEMLKVWKLRKNLRTEEIIEE